MSRPGPCFGLSEKTEAEVLEKALGFQPTDTRVKDADLVVIRYHSQVSVLYGRCLHRGALFASPGLSVADTQLG